jgi:Flp pilus assembly protein TadD
MEAGARAAGAPRPRQHASVGARVRGLPGALRRAPAVAWRHLAALRLTFGILGVALVAVSVVRPWLEVPLQDRQKATQLRVVIGGLPTNRWITYGAVAAALAGIAALAIVWRRGRVSAVLGAAGIGVLLMCGFLVAQLVLWDAGTRHLLVGQTLQKAVAVKQFGYSVRATQPSAFFVVPLSGVGKVVAGSLDLGFWLCVLGGAAMTAAGLPALLAWLKRHTRLGPAALAGAVMVLAGAAAPGVVAWYSAGSAAAAVQRGDSMAALRSLDLSQRLVPSYRDDPDAELVRGTALLQLGDRVSGPALFVQSRNDAAEGDRPRELARLAEALRRSPGDSVVVEEWRARAIDYAVRVKDPSPLLDLPPSVADDALVQYVTGRLLYDLGSFDQATIRFRRVLSLTPDRDVLSSVHTYIGLADLQRGLPDQAKHELVLAIELDGTASNGLARSTATGLFRGVLP